jgi:hypothetical protein
MEAFEDPVLSELIDQALANNFNLKTALDRLNQVEALARRAGADLSPALDIEAGCIMARCRLFRRIRFVQLVNNVPHVIIAFSSASSVSK